MNLDAKSTTKPNEFSLLTDESPVKSHWSKFAIDLASNRSKDDAIWNEFRLNYAKVNGLSASKCHRLISAHDDYHNVCSIVKRFQEKNPSLKKEMPLFESILSINSSSDSNSSGNEHKQSAHGITQISRIGKLIHHATESSINDLYWKWVDRSLKEDVLNQAEQIWLNKSQNNRVIGRPLGRTSKLQSSDGVFAYQKYASSVMVDLIAKNPSNYGLSGKIIKIHKDLNFDSGVTASVALLMQDNSTQPHLKTVHIEVDSDDGLSSLKRSGADVRMLMIMPSDKNNEDRVWDYPFNIVKLKTKNGEQFDFEVENSLKTYRDDKTPTESTGNKIKFMSACLLGDSDSLNNRKSRNNSFY